MRTLPTGFFRTLCAALVLGGAPAAWSQPSGSLDTWVEACEVASRDLAGLLDKEALIVTSAALTDNRDGTFTLAQQPYTHSGIQSPIALCSESIFYGQPQVNGDSFRSAVLVGPDLVLTAWHNPVTSVPDVRVIFGLQYRPAGDSCIPPDFTRIPATSIFRPVQVVGSTYPYPDMALFRLDRNVGAAPLRVRRSGEGQPGDGLTMIGHPDRLATKVDTAGVLTGYQTGTNGRVAPLVANLHTLVGSSGAMVYNRSERFVETVAAWWVGLTYQPCSGKVKVAHVDGASTTNYSVKHFARYVPAFELLVEPLDKVVHVGPVGGPFTNPVFQRTIRAPVTAAGPIGYSVQPPPPGHPPVLETSFEVTPQGALVPGQSFVAVETIDADGAACGVYERTYSVRDVTHGYTDVVRHVFEIGLREFTVDPPGPARVSGTAGPEAEVRYTVTNLRPTPYSVEVTADADWAALNGVAGGKQPVILDLPPFGTATVEVTMDPARALRAAPRAANVRFAAVLEGCPGSPPVERAVTSN